MSFNLVNEEGLSEFSIRLFLIRIKLAETEKLFSKSEVIDYKVYTSETNESCYKVSLSKTIITLRETLRHAGRALNPPRVW